MDEPGDDREDRSRPHEDGRRRGGPPRDTEFLDLEISSVLYGDADRMCREAARELIREAIRERLRERLGAQLEEIGRLAADVLADDIETNLQIESLIVERRDARGSIGERVAEIMRQKGSAQARGRDRKASKKKKKR